MMNINTINDGVKSLVRRLIGFYQIRTHLEMLERDICYQIAELAESLSRMILEANVSPKQASEDIVASISAMQKIFHDIRLSNNAAQAAEKRGKIRKDLSRNGLFIVGHARTGTSILQMALNSSPEIFLLGEANIHQHHAMPGFAEWYRAMHKSFNNPPSKNTSCPNPDDPSGNAFDVLLTLRQQYRLVGDKLAFRSSDFGYDFAGAYRFLQDYFGGSYIIGTLRHPRDVIGSNALMFNPDNINDYVISYLECIALEIDLTSTFDRATILVHEIIDTETFIRLGEWLDCDLHHAYARFYQPHYREPRHACPDGVAEDLLELACSYYTRLRQQFEGCPFDQPSTREIASIRYGLGVDIQRLKWVASNDDVRLVAQ